MDKKIKISELPEFDATRYLEDEQDIAMYLTCVLEENDAALLARPSATSPRRAA